MKRTPKEWAEITYKAIQRKKALREKRIKDADSYGYDMRLKNFKKKSKIRYKTYRGK